jgi:formylglycine-generating enzyme required for sulfatase activity
MSGNIWEWTNDTIKANEKPSRIGEMGATDSNWRELTDITLYGALRYDLVRPSNATWNSTQNMGKYYKGAGNNATLYVLSRGGGWNSHANAGLFYLDIDDLPVTTNITVGFRCVVTAGA